MRKLKFARKKIKLSKKQTVLLVILLFFLVALTISLVTLFHYTGLINHIKGFDALNPSDEYFDSDEDLGYDRLDPNKIKWDTSGPLGDEDLLNILLVGQDRRPGEGRQRSDAILVCSINMDTGKVSLISFMRDMYVQIPGYSDNKINAAYAFGGFPLLKETIYQNFGMTVDGCFEVDFNGFESVINAIGGVNIQLSKGEAEIVGVTYSSEPVHLSGAQALTYSRIRYLDSDFGRTQRQRNVIMAAFSKVRTRSVQELLALLDKVLPLITTDMSTVGIYRFAAQILPLVTKMEVSTHNVPFEGTYKNANVRGMMVLVPDLAAIKKELKEVVLPF